MMPRHFVFLLDALGALLSVILLRGVLPAYQEYVGMPFFWLDVLSGAAFVMFLFSAGSYLLARRDWLTPLRIIIGCNALYFLVSASTVVYHFPQLTGWGLGYFIVELLVLAGVMTYEIQVYRGGMPETPPPS